MTSAIFCATPAWHTEYVKGAQKLREKDSPIRFAKVDGPENQDLLEKMHVTGYPTLIFYRQGEPVPYAGETLDLTLT